MGLRSFFNELEATERTHADETPQIVHLPSDDPRFAVCGHRWTTAQARPSRSGDIPCKVCENLDPNRVEDAAATIAS